MIRAAGAPRRAPRPSSRGARGVRLRGAIARGVPVARDATCPRSRQIGSRKPRSVDRVRDIGDRQGWAGH